MCTLPLLCPRRVGFKDTRCPYSVLPFLLLLIILNSEKGMKNKVYWVICICPLWLFLSNCVDKFNAHLPESSIGLLIVEGSIISDSAVVFSLSRSFSLDVEGVPPDFNKVDAEVCVTGEDGSSFRGVALGNGKYRVAVGTLHRDVRYSLKIVYE